MASDYGFYGRTGKYSCEDLPVNQQCKCSGFPILHCEYDDTPGFRETVYQIKCSKCEIMTRDTCVIENVISDWNNKSN